MKKTIDLPDELAERISSIPDLDARLVRFIMSEAVLHERRRKRFSPETLELLRMSRDAAERMREEGFDRSRFTEEVGDFITNLKA